MQGVDGDVCHLLIQIVISFKWRAVEINSKLTKAHTIPFFLRWAILWRLLKMFYHLHTRTCITNILVWEPGKENVVFAVSLLGSELNVGIIYFRTILMEPIAIYNGYANKQQLRLIFCSTNMKSLHFLQWQIISQLCHASMQQYFSFPSTASICSLASGGDTLSPTSSCTRTLRYCIQWGSFRLQILGAKIALNPKAQLPQLLRW